MPRVTQVVSALLEALQDDLRKPQYRGHSHPLRGHCYTVAEVLHHYFFDDWKPMQIRHEGESHWFLKHRATGAILDPTASQFETPVDYKKGRGRAFLTSTLSKRSQILLSHVEVTLNKNESKGGER